MVQVVHRAPLDDVVQPVVVDGLGERLLHQPRDVVGLVHPRRPPLRRAGDGRPAGPAPAPGPLGGRLSPAARVQLVVRHGPPVPHARLQPDRLPAAVGPEGLLGDQGRDQHHGGAPVAGPYLQKILVGGPDYGNQTVTRFYGLHVGVLPTLFVLCLAAHIALFRRHGITPPPDAEQRPTAKFWPEQLFMDTVFSAAVVGVVIVPGAGRGGSQPRRPGRSVQLRLPRAARVVLPVALPDAQAVPGRPRDRSARS